MPRLGKILSDAGLAVQNQLISGSEKQEMAEQGTQFDILEAALEAGAKYGAAWLLKVKVDDRKREMYFGTGEHIDEMMKVIAKECLKEPVGPVVLYSYRNRAGQTGYGIAEVESSPNLNEMEF